MDALAAWMLGSALALTVVGVGMPTPLRNTACASANWPFLWHRMAIAIASSTVTLRGAVGDGFMMDPYSKPARTSTLTDTRIAVSHVEAHAKRSSAGISYFNYATLAP